MLFCNCNVKGTFLGFHWYISRWVWKFRRPRERYRNRCNRFRVVRDGFTSFYIAIRLLIRFEILFSTERRVKKVLRYERNIFPWKFLWKDAIKSCSFISYVLTFSMIYKNRMQLTEKYSMQSIFRIFHHKM